MSRKLSLHLRHRPGAVGLELDPAGWVDVGDLLSALARRRFRVTRAELEQVVTGGDKQRFELSADGRRVRARYGHSVDVDPGHEPVPPPDRLYHGTSEGAVDAILGSGVARMGRRQVHLSGDADSARRVGARHGLPVVLVVDAAAMAHEGVRLVRAAEGTWLTAAVAPRHILGVLR